MKYCRFEFEGREQYGLVESVAGREVITRLLLAAPEEHGGVADIPSKTMTALPLGEAKLLVPVRPSKIVCVGRNYRGHAAEMNQEVPKQPLIFFKPPSSLLAQGGTILRPRSSQRTHYEGELGVVIGKRCRKLAVDEDVRPYILGYTALNDFSARDLQDVDGQWARAKGFDTFCPVGPLVTEQLDPWAGVGVQTRVNGELRQDGNTRDLIFPLDAIIRFAAEVMTLLPGDLIATGTPQGVGAVVSGDVVEVTVEGVGTLRNPVLDE
ncbi:MAG: fumarylacetoacetate hydrolase family protein [Acidobacteriia bacterium]|nr:fumarylacetoacetate hydrolase family protein [Terriglobia bacterium]